MTASGRRASQWRAAWHVPLHACARHGAQAPQRVTGRPRATVRLVIRIMIATLPRLLCYSCRAGEGRKHLGVPRRPRNAGCTNTMIREYCTNESTRERSVCRETLSPPTPANYLSLLTYDDVTGRRRAPLHYRNDCTITDVLTRTPSTSRAQAIETLALTALE